MIKLRLQYYILSSIKQNPIIYTFVKKTDLFTFTFFIHE